MSTPTSDNHPNEGPPNGVPPVRFEPEEIETLKGLLGRGILAGEWLLVQRVAALLHHAQGVPDGANVPSIDDILNATKLHVATWGCTTCGEPLEHHPGHAPCVPPGPAGIPMIPFMGPTARTAGDTPEGEQPYGVACDGYNASDPLVDLCDMCGSPRNAH